MTIGLDSIKNKISSKGVRIKDAFTRALHERIQNVCALQNCSVRHPVILVDVTNCFYSDISEYLNKKRFRMQECQTLSYKMRKILTISKAMESKEIIFAMDGFNKNRLCKKYRNEEKEGKKKTIMRQLRSTIDGNAILHQIVAHSLHSLEKEFDGIKCVLVEAVEGDCICGGSQSDACIISYDSDVYTSLNYFKGTHLVNIIINTNDLIIRNVFQMQHLVLESISTKFAAGLTTEDMCRNDQLTPKQKMILFLITGHGKYSLFMLFLFLSLYRLHKLLYTLQDSLSHVT